MSKYDMIYTLTKRDSLHDYLCTHKIICGMYGGEVRDLTKEFYEREREISLMVAFRFERDKTRKTSIFCRIKCPINPLPVKGEFEVPSTTSVLDFLKANGWTLKQKFYPNMFD